MFIDTHSHLNFEEAYPDVEEVIRRSLENDTRLILVGADYKTSRKGLELANKYDHGVYAAVGLHPTHANQNNDNYERFDYDNYEKLARSSRVIAIGEIGLDYYHIDQGDDKYAIIKAQQLILAQQLQLSRSLNLPIIIHCREAHEDMINILKDFKKEYVGSLPKDKPWGVVHCFSGDENLAWEYFALGLIISFTGLP